MCQLSRIAITSLNTCRFLDIILHVAMHGVAISNKETLYRLIHRESTGALNTSRHFNQESNFGRFSDTYGATTAQEYFSFA